MELARALEAERLHHVSSIAVAGEYKGRFEEDMFDEGQKLPSPYHRTKFESERIVREQPYVPWRVYRPGIVVGDSQTGEMDKVDGPYYFFKAIQRRAQAGPRVAAAGRASTWARRTWCPVDWVAGALDHIAHEPDLDGRAFHLTDPRPSASTSCSTSSPPPRTRRSFAVSVDKRLTDAAADVAAVAGRARCRRCARRASSRCASWASPRRCSRTWS